MGFMRYGFAVHGKFESTFGDVGSVWERIWLILGNFENLKFLYFFNGFRFFKYWTIRTNLELVYRVYDRSKHYFQAFWNLDLKRFFEKILFLENFWKLFLTLSNICISFSFETLAWNFEESFFHLKNQFEKINVIFFKF